MDQQINAEHVAASGAGVHMAGGLAAVPELPDAVLGLLDTDTHRQAAKWPPTRWSTLPPVSEVVQRLKQIAER